MSGSVALPGMQSPSLWGGSETVSALMSPSQTACTVLKPTALMATLCKVYPPFMLYTEGERNIGCSKPEGCI